MTAAAAMSGMSGVLVALVAGASGAVITLCAAEFAKFRAARDEVRIHDNDARERNEQLVIWVDDETQNLVLRLAAIRQEFNSREGLASSPHDSARVQAKAHALHRYRDQASRARLDIAALRAQEGHWHRFWRK